MWHCTSEFPPVRRHPPKDHTILIWLQLDAASATLLRQTVIRAGMDAVRFLRVDACASGGPVRALLCVERAAAPALRDEVQRSLPGCEWHEATQRREYQHDQADGR